MPDEARDVMGSSTNAIRGRNFAELGEILRRDAEEIIERWSDRALAQGHGRPGAHRAELRDHLPEFLVALGEDLFGDEPDDSGTPRRRASEHGRFRWQVGWELEDVVVDYQILRIVILQHLRKVLNREPKLDEVVAIGVHIDDAIAEAVVGYVGHQSGQLAQAHQRLNEFLGVLGHELRNPLGTIAVALQLARLSSPPGGDLAEAVESISRSAGTMTRLMDDMLDVARVTRGDLEIRPRRVSVAEAIEASVSSVLTIVNERHHTLELSILEGGIYVEADPTRLEQVIGNLITNAAKYTEPGGRIEVSAHCEGDQAVIRVRDNGSGIDPAFLPQLFELFSQAPEHNGRGLGIGLSLVKSLVDRHGGTITAQSGGPGLGSTFTVRLPRVESPAADSPSRSSNAPSSVGSGTPPCSPFRILVVDDERDAARLLALLLEQDGHEVSVAFDGQSALDLAEASRPDLVLLDLGLPDLNGAEVARRLRSSAGFDRTLIVALSGFSPGQRPGDSPTAPDHDPSFDLFLTKPVEADQLSRVLAIRDRLDGS